MTANPGGGDYRPDETDGMTCGCGGRIVPETFRGAEHHICTECEACPECELCMDGDHTPASVAQDATDATETPARTPGGSGTTEARTEAQGERKARYARAIFDDQIVSYDPDEVDEVTEAVMAVADAERESATDPGMTNLEAELVALRAQVADAWDAGYAVASDDFIHSDYCGLTCRCDGIHGQTNPYRTKGA